MNSMNFKLYLVALFVGAMVCSSLAKKDCDFQFFRDNTGDLTQIDVADKLVAIRIDRGSSSWQGLVKGAREITISDEKGSTDEILQADLSPSQQKSLEELFQSSVEGSRIEKDAGSIGIRWTNPVLPLEMKHIGNDVTAVRGHNLYAHLHVHGFDEAKYRHIFALNKLAVVLVHTECKKVEIVPYGAVEDDVKQIIETGLATDW